MVARRAPTVILVACGSRHSFPRLWLALDALVLRIGVPDEVRVREQVGVDQDARAWCRARGYPLNPFAADMSLPLPDCYHDGNRRMVTKTTTLTPNRIGTSRPSRLTKYFSIAMPFRPGGSAARRRGASDGCHGEEDA